MKNKQERIKFYKEIYQDEDLQRIGFAFYLLTSLMAVGFFTNFVFSISLNLSSFVISFLVIWAIVSIMQIVLHLRGYSITTGNMIVMILAASIVAFSGLMWLFFWLFPMPTM